jgi:hypothetical protein
MPSSNSNGSSGTRVTRAQLEELSLVLICHSSSAPEIVKRVDTDLYSTPTNRMIAQAAIPYVRKYGGPPGSVLEHLLEAELRRGESGKLLTQCLKLLKEQAPWVNPKFFLDQLDLWIKLQHWGKAGMQLQELSEQGDLDGITKTLSGALTLGSNGAGTSSTLKFETGPEFAATTTAETKFIVLDLIPEASTVQLVGKPKSGKTSIAMSLVKAVVTGQSFLGNRCLKSPVVYATEQPPSSLRAVLQRVGLLDQPDFHMLRWSNNIGAKWEEYTYSTFERAHQVGAKLAVFDTLPHFAGLKGDQENDSGVALQVMKPLIAAANDGISSLAIVHERKAGGDVTDAGRGSGAFAGAVDVVLRLSRPIGAGYSANARKLETQSRFEEIPPELLVERMADGTYHGTTDLKAVALAERIRKVEAVLPQTLNLEEGLTYAELEEKTGIKNRADLIHALKEISGVQTSGGTRGDKKRFVRMPPSTITRRIQ